VFGHLLAAMADDNDQMVGLKSRSRRNRVPDQRSAGELVHDLRDGRLHPRALTGGKDDDSGQAWAHARAPGRRWQGRRRRYL
jgi:hypothetical protein